MKKDIHKINSGLIIILFLGLITGCVDKFDISQFEIDDNGNANIGGDTLYIQLSPVWQGFNQPRDIIIGKESFIYVADTENDRIVMMNQAGEILGSKSVKKPIALAQDFELDLIICAQFDTLGQTFSAVYTLDLFSVNHRINEASLTRLLPRAGSADFNFPQREYTAAAAFYDNSFFIARKGPGNTSIFDPDNSILIFHPKSFYNKGEGDTLIGRVPNIDPLSSGLISANQITSLSSFNKNNLDFVATLNGNNSFKAQWFHYQVTAIDERYISQFTPSDGVGFIEPQRFNNPEGSWIDNTGNIYIADAGKDSIFKFNSFGDEMESFGGSKVFNKPHAVAFFDRTLYVADTGNNRILRFTLSTDLR
jgi:hypothetical protein